MNRRIEHKNFVPLRLREARFARNYTMAKLAQKVGITRQAISQFENGLNSPSANIAIQLSKELNVPLNYFYKSLTSDDQRISPIFFRKLNSATKRNRLQAEIYEEWFTHIINFLSEYLDFPNLDIFNKEFDYGNLIDEDLEETALELRKYWGLGISPIPNMTLLLENKGIAVGQHHISSQLDSYSCWRKNRPHIILNTNQRTAVRYRFDIAHELAHLIFHKHLTEEELEEKSTHKMVENQANKFASMFLMPTEPFVRDFISSSMATLKHLKKRWLVSIQAIAYRAHDLNLINDNQMSYVYKMIAPNKKFEPLDDEITRESPVLLSRAINMLVENEVLTKDEILLNLGLHEDDVVKLASLSPNYFDKEFENNNVVELNFKRIQ